MSEKREEGKKERKEVVRMERDRVMFRNFS